MWITRKAHHGRHLIRGIRHNLSSPCDRFTGEQRLRAYQKVTGELVLDVDQFTRCNSAPGTQMSGAYPRRTRRVPGNPPSIKSVMTCIFRLHPLSTRFP
jgi:hypothetical protein